MKTIALVCLLTITACSQTRKAEQLRPDDLMRPVAIKLGSTVTVRYIANEGVLIAAGGKQVLIDGLHREYRPAYLFPPPELQVILENARPPYDKIDVLLVSHVHLDHFHPESIGSYLKGNPRSIFASSDQAITDVANKFAEHAKVKSQILPVTHEWKKSTALDVNGIKVKFLGLRHGSERFKDIQNLGHVIEIGGKKFLHIGDADMTAENFASFNLAAENIDVAFIPYWFLMSPEGRNLVREQFNAKQIIAVHISPDESEKVIEQLKKDLPGALAFTRILQEQSF